MIWFSCSQCNKPLGRPDSSAGALVFCTCGQGNVVPWESTIAAPPAAPEAEAPPPLRPVPVGEEQIPAARRPAPPPLDPGEARPARTSPGAPRMPGRCFNHQDRPAQYKCEACNEGFCADCLLHFQGQGLCGPCKNFRLRQKEKPGTMSIKAVTAMVMSLVAGFGVSCLWPFGTGGAAMLFCVFGLIFQLAAVVLGGLALYETEVNPSLTGRSLAITGVLTGVLSSLLTMFFVILGPR
jgi:hypothetical protein